ncbi:BRAP2 RING ZnF UBP domain-containing protein 1 isoform X2 [Aristolochia californica]|uniref:BRAP2 RING ZnF UBP domain-containing protein 1 isoform X2 n=1 Tax=Aristolochia californica TaxID=171875 RepID=UPI0035DA6C90
MFRLRIHTLDVPFAEAESSQQNSRNPRIEESKGVIHLYRFNSRESEAVPDTPSSLVFVLAVPARLSSDDFLRFCGPYVDHISLFRYVRNDGVDDRYSVLVNFDSQDSANCFYADVNGHRFSSWEAEVCHMLFIVGVEYTEFTDIAGTPPVGYTELPTCPFCLERLDQEISGITTTLCDHSFQCSCISKWRESSCPVCRFCLQQPAQPTCSVCQTSENLWICLICGFIGCGRYKQRHAVRHWEETQHCYSLDLQIQRVWDYAGDNFVHRLNQSKPDGKSVKMRPSCQSTDEECGTCECSEDSGISGALFKSKSDAIVDEYNRLLTSQLENQRQTYESQVMEAKGKREIAIADAIEKEVNLKLHDVQLELERCMDEIKVIAGVNENLMKKQESWQNMVKEIEQRHKAAG